MSKRPGLYANIAAKKRRIKAGSKEKMKKKGAKGAPTAANFKRAAKTARKNTNFVLEVKQQLKENLMYIHRRMQTPMHLKFVLAK